ncbi:MAG: tyrosine--tRNA ligase [Candidatus Nealsonbacteria bacterium RBG_13_36_15]|uniref:Tyrosine--tRNA ligase n=1 Tax=Candidatus Nealsonbacteria bacterium RBG_13_36_15 TaxID=1801660 RepID=A0A1G2DVN7_9BACT|nr:MAG: tyrosine--tRNA ligase [Candidatus Nealsonbacteria bacterium RBG_13_36_15]
MKKVSEQLKILTEGEAEILPVNSLKEKLIISLKRKRPLRVKLGVDPTAPDLHLGLAVSLRKMRQFQQLGHKVIIIIGDLTALIGDPTGRSKTRPSLSKEKILANAKTYINQLSKILNLKKTKIVFNSQWLEKLTLKETIKLAASYNVSRMLERDDFKKRYRSGTEIAIHEFLYPLLQGYDSVVIKADIEVGGTDQRFNLLVGRDIQKSCGQLPQCCFLVPLLEGIDGKEKMSKSLGNYVSLIDGPADMFGKIMSIPDGLIIKYFRLCSDINAKTINVFEKDLREKRVNPRDLKMKLAFNIVEIYHSKDKSLKAGEHFRDVFQKKQLPSKMPEYTIIQKKEIFLTQLMIKLRMAKSKSEAKRLIRQGGVKINQKKVENIYQKITAKEKIVLQVGPRKFAKIIFRS